MTTSFGDSACRGVGGSGTGVGGSGKGGDGDGRGEGGGGRSSGDGKGSEVISRNSSSGIRNVLQIVVGDDGSRGYGSGYWKSILTHLSTV